MSSDRGRSEAEIDSQWFCSLSHPLHVLHAECIECFVIHNALLLLLK
jgi:hypothetical protein